MKRIESQIVYGRDEQMVFYAGQFMTFERMMLTIGLVQLADVVRPAGLVRRSPTDRRPRTKISVLRARS